MDIGATAEQEAIHRGEGSVALLGGGACVDADRSCAVSLDGGHIQVIASSGEIRTVTEMSEA
jgi:hypothetical protein